MVVRRALGISGITQAAIFVLGFINVVIVSRLLRPEEIGVFSVAVSVLGFAHVFREFGVGQYLVQAATVGREQFRAAFTVTLISSWLIALLLFLISKPMAAFYKHPGIAEVLGLLCINFLVMPLGTPLLAMLRRELAFDKLAWANILSAVVQTGVTIAAAYAGQSYLSMAWGSIAMHLSKALILNYFRPGMTLVLPTFRGLGEVLRFGSMSSLAAIVKEAGAAAPDLILGRTLGFVEVAIFSRGVGLHRMLVDRINTLVRGVHFPTFAQQVREGSNASELYIQATYHLTVVTLPILAVLGILAEPLILFVFGSQWQASVPVAQMICTGSIITVLYTLAGLSLTAVGRVAGYMRMEIYAQSVRVLVLLSSIWLDFSSVVWLLLLAYVFEAGAAQFSLRETFGLRLASLLARTWKVWAVAACASLGPAALMLAAGQWPAVEQHRLALLIGGSLTAAIGWTAGVMLLDHPIRAELGRLLRYLRARIPARSQGN